MGRGLENLFTKHPQQVGETYIEHMLVSLSYSLTFFLLSVTSLVHAFLPFLFINTGSNSVFYLYEVMKDRKKKDASKT